MEPFSVQSKYNRLTHARKEACVPTFLFYYPCSTARITPRLFFLRAPCLDLEPVRTCSDWYTVGMALEFGQPITRDYWWAAAEEFKLLPAVDPAFAPENLGPLRKLILRYFALPLGYRQSPVKLIAHWDGKRCGFVFTRNSGGALHIDSLGVIPQFQRQGIGFELVKEVEIQAQLLKFDYLTAAVTQGNVAARELLRKAGLKPYRALNWIFTGEAISTESVAAWQIREYSPTEILPAYERWQKVAVESGDAWVEELMLGDYARLNWRAAARHWACLVDEQEVGYLRVAGLRKDFAAYLALAPEWWGSLAQVTWLKLALDSYPNPPVEISVGLAADAQFEPGRAVWEAAGFHSQVRERFLCVYKI